MAEGNGIQRDLGYFEAQIETLVSGMAKLETKVDRIERTLSEAKGGWRMLLLVGSAGGALGAMITKLLPFLQFKA